MTISSNDYRIQKLVDESNALKSPDEPAIIALKAEFNPDGTLSYSGVERVLSSLSKTHYIALKTIEEGGKKIGEIIKESSRKLGNRRIESVIFFAHGDSAKKRVILGNPDDPAKSYCASDVSADDFNGLPYDATIILFSCRSAALGEKIAEIQNRAVFGSPQSIIESDTWVGSGTNGLELIAYNENGECLSRRYEKKNGVVNESLPLSYTNETMRQIKQESLAWLQAETLKGNPNAQFGLGSWHLEGEGVEKSYSEAIKLFDLAAAQGHVGAQHSLGNIYLAGTGVAPSHKKAFEFYLKAASSGHSLPDAAFYLGIMYLRGMGVDQSTEEGAKWILKAAHEGYDDAMVAAGTLYFEAMGVERSFEKAAKWYSCVRDPQKLPSRILHYVPQSMMRYLLIIEFIARRFIGTIIQLSQALINFCTPRAVCRS